MTTPKTPKIVPQTLDPELRERFIGGMAHAANTVNVVTTDGAAGRAGVTVSAMTSVSADTPKPTLLVCVHHLSPAAAAILRNRVFCVNVLRDDQSFISDTFAGRVKAPADARADAEADKFACTEWAGGVTGAPRAVDALVAFDCQVLSGERVGTHHVFIGEVQDIVLSGRGSPLLYARRAYARTAHIDPATPAGHVAGGEHSRGGYRNRDKFLRMSYFHTFGPYLLPEIIERLSGDPEIDLRLVEGDHRRVVESLGSGETDVALLYDFDLGERFDIDPLGEVQPYVLLSAHHALAARETLSLAELSALPMILLDSPPSADYFISLFTAAGLHPNVRYRSASFEMVRGLVGRGLGYALLATRPASDLSYDGRPLVARPLDSPLRPSRVVLAFRKGRPLPPVVRLFAELCHDLFAND